VPERGVAKRTTMISTLCGCLLALVLAWPSAATAAEFTGEMVIREGEKIMTGKIFVKNGKLRQDFQDDLGHSITIVRPDKKVIWVILLHHRNYMELRFLGTLPGQFLQVPPGAVQKRKVGTDTIQGYPTEKVEVLVQTVKGGLQKETYWVAPKLGMPLKMVCHDRNLSLEYRHLKEGQVPDRLFELPPGLKKLDKPTGIIVGR